MVSRWVSEEQGIRLWVSGVRISERKSKIKNQNVKLQSKNQKGMLDARGLRI